MLDRRVRQRDPPPATHAQLLTALREEWTNIPMNTVNNLMESMPRRIQALEQAQGGHTRY